MITKKSYFGIRTIIGIVFLLLLSACSGESPSDNVGDRILAEVVKTQELDHPLIVFKLEEPLQPGDVIGAYLMDGYEPVPEQKTIEAETWFFWIDDFPSAEYVHPTRFVFVDVESGVITVQQEMWWPVLNGESLWVEKSDYWDEVNWIYTNGDFKPQEELTRQSKKVLMNRVNGPMFQEKSPGKAIVINGWEPGQSLGENFAENVKQIFEVVDDANFETSYFGPENPDIPASETQSDYEYTDLLDWFDGAAEDLKTGDTLIIYITAHGWVLKDLKTGQIDGISEKNLAFMLRNIDPGVHVIIQLQACFSGSFIDGLQDISDLTLTSTNDNSISVADVDGGFLIFGITEPNPEDRGSEFTNGWVSDWKEIQADPVQKAEAIRRAESNGTNYWTELSALSYVSSLEKDAGYLSGRSFPIAARGTAASRPAVLVDESNDGKMCNTGEPLPGDTPPSVDIKSAKVSSNPETNTLDVDIELQGLGQSIDQLFGGIEVRDEARPVSPPDSHWIFEGLGNLNFNFQYTLEGLRTSVHSFDSDSGWSDASDLHFDAEIVGNHILASIPEEFVPPFSSFYIYTSDYQACDSVGLDQDRNLSGLIPGELENDTISAQPTNSGE